MLIADAMPIKGFARALEKAILRPGSGVPWDLVRGQLQCSSCTGIASAISMLEKRSNLPEDHVDRIVFVTANNRYKNPAAGWRDISLYFIFPNLPPAVCEIQVVHDKLVVAREQLGAHASRGSCCGSATLIGRSKRRAGRRSEALS